MAVNNSVLLKKSGMFVSKNSPTILTGLAVAGVIGTVIIAVRATPKATELLKDLNNVTEGEPTVIDKAKVLWKPYLPAGGMALATILCIIGANSVHLRRSAAIAALYSVSEQTLKEYQHKVFETFGEKKEAKIRDEIMRDRVVASKNALSEIVITDNGDVIAYDAFSGRYFTSDIEKIRQAVNVVNRELLTQDEIALNELYALLGLPPTKSGELMGWSVDGGLLEVRFSSQLTEKNKPCLVMDYDVNPKYI